MVILFYIIYASELKKKKKKKRKEKERERNIYDG